MDAPGLLLLFICFVAGYWALSKWLDGRNKHKAPQHGAEAPPPGWQQQRSWMREPAGPRWFEVLEVSQFSSAAQIRAAYAEKIRAYHPDRVAGLGPEIRDIAERKSREINRAYEIALLQVKKP